MLRMTTAEVAMAQETVAELVNAVPDNVINNPSNLGEHLIAFTAVQTALAMNQIRLLAEIRDRLASLTPELDGPVLQ